MAVASMKIVNIAGPMSMFDEVARITVTSSSFAPEDALSFYRNNKYFMRLTQGWSLWMKKIKTLL